MRQERRACRGPGRPGDEGLELLDEIVDQHPNVKVVMVTGNTNRENALLAIRRGAVDWYGKPIELAELRSILKRALHIRAIEQAEAFPAGYGEENDLCQRAERAGFRHIIAGNVFVHRDYHAQNLFSMAHHSVLGEAVRQRPASFPI